MRAIVHLSQSRKRALFARTLNQLTMGLSFAVGSLTLSSSLMAQQCDRCAGQVASISGPTCGCETPSPAKCKPKCVPKPSFAEKILRRFDKLGDSIEANMKKPSKGTCADAKSGPSCGCEPAAAPSCGCEPAVPSCGCEPVAPSCGCENAAPSCGCETSAMQPSTTIGQFQTPTSTKSRQAFPGDPNKHAIGSIGDQHIALPTTPSVQAKQDGSVKSPTAVEPTSKDSLESIAETSLPTAPAPFEKRTPEVATQKQLTASQPELDAPPPALLPKEHKVLAPVPPKRLPPAPLPAAEPPKALQPTPIEQSLPDVLVDPFKDDASVRKTRDQMEGILLISSRQSKAQTVHQGSASESTATQQIVPSRLPPSQSKASGIQFDAEEPVVQDAPTVVPTAYQQAVPVKVSQRKAVSASLKENAPSVSKIPVPHRK